MNGCLNKNLPEYQSLKNSSGLSEQLLDIWCVTYINKFQRLPRLDELPNVNSKPALDKLLNVKDGKYTTVQDVINAMGEGSAPEINSRLNDRFCDQETKIIPLNEGVIVESKPRPSEYVRHTEELENYLQLDDVSTLNSKVVITDAINKLSNLYGINIHPITNEELAEGPLADIVVSNPITINAFIHNGEIYVNTDTASVDAPIHELLHIFIGSLRFKNQNLYMELLLQVLQLPDFEAQFKSYKNRTESDILEEILVTEFAKHLTGLESAFDNLDDTKTYEFMYHLNRTLDSVLMGKYSVKSINQDKLPKMTLRQLARKVHSAMLINMSPVTMNEAQLHRCYLNFKSELMEKNELKQECI